ncbi:Nitrosoguanidine resistance protein SNG1 [Candida viswanathii]|uniref:Nitrosoguanidine resistance protein SNG1 n=1 Tax=Candida viswanathii TaxID=5486 RepID=A0A367YLL4_9ASCO|nr:Nitrosoguanidine resistance protein SNG1 [Candida viswanathii]
MGPTLREQPVLSRLNDTQRELLVSSNETLSILTTFPTFTFDDQRPVTDSAGLAPSEVQLIYALLISFYSFNFSMEIFAYMKKRIVYRSYLFYKFLISQFHALLIGLVYALIPKAFRISTSETFGKLGFLVLWMLVYLFISAAAVINEVVVLVFLAIERKELIAPWMTFNIVSIVSCTFSPFVLMPGFYRYGYAMPMYNAYEALKVVFFNTWKGHLGRNIGVLVVWIVVDNVILIFITGWTTRRAKRIAHEERRKQDKS